MGFLSIVLTFIGYVLVYASVAGPPGKGGRFATAPWAGLFADAYEDAPDAGTSTGKPGTPAPKKKSGGGSGIEIKPLPFLPGIKVPIP